MQYFAITLSHRFFLYSHTAFLHGEMMKKIQIFLVAVCGFFVAYPSLVQAKIFGKSNSGVKPLSPTACSKVKPVVVLHGVLASKKNMDPFVEALQRACPDLDILNMEINLPVLGEFTTLGNIYYLIHRLRLELLFHPKLQQGYNFVAASLGGMWARGIVQEFNQDPIGYQVENLITWATPHRGVYGIPGVDNTASFPTFVDENLWKVFYTKTYQQTLSLAELWHDPSQEAAYKKTLVLPYLNNEVLHPKSTLYKNNMTSLQSFHVFASPTLDQVVHPPESASFGFYYPNDPNGPVQPYQDTNFYKWDVLGIRTLEKSGRFVVTNVACEHDQFASNPEVQRLTLQALGISSADAAQPDVSRTRVENVSLNITDPVQEKYDLMKAKKYLVERKNGVSDPKSKKEFQIQLDRVQQQLYLLDKFKSTRASSRWWDQQFEPSRWKRFVHRVQFREDDIGKWLRKGFSVSTSL